MTRKALLIGNNTGYQAPTFLKGVNKDLINYSSYLKSGIGGAWVGNTEIKILHNQSRKTILAAIKACQADYSFVVFSGHGYINSRDGLTYICVSDGHISEDELNTYLYRRTLILDCCREISVTEGFIGDIGESFEKGGLSSILGVRRTIKNPRQKFDNALAASSRGYFTGYACLTDQLSGDNPLLGGVFSSALIRAGIYFGSKDSYDYTWMAIKAAVQEANFNIGSDPFSSQQPEYVITPSNMNPTYPFALTNQILRNQW